MHKTGPCARLDLSHTKQDSSKVQTACNVPFEHTSYGRNLFHGKLGVCSKGKLEGSSRRQLAYFWCVTHPVEMSPELLVGCLPPMFALVPPKEGLDKLGWGWYFGDSLPEFFCFFCLEHCSGKQKCLDLSAQSTQEVTRLGGGLESFFFDLLQTSAQGFSASVNH